MQKSVVTCGTLKRGCIVLELLAISHVLVLVIGYYKEDIRKEVHFGLPLILLLTPSCIPGRRAGSELILGGTLLYFTERASAI